MPLPSRRTRCLWQHDVLMTAPDRSDVSSPCAPPPEGGLAPAGWAQRSATLLQEQLARLQGRDLHLFAYGSLIWRTEFEHDGQWLARVQGFHRALRMRSRVYRGTPEQPGLVLALLSGGCCTGVVYRIAAARAPEVLRQVWAREMVNGSYQARWLRCHALPGQAAPSESGHVALGFTLSRRSPQCSGLLSDSEVLGVLRHAHGRYGSSLEYLERTVLSLRQRGIRDRELERLYGLARSHGLCEPGTPTLRPGA